MKPSPSNPFFLLGFLWLKEVDFLIFLLEWFNEWLETMTIDLKSVSAIGIPPLHWDALGE